MAKLLRRLAGKKKEPPVNSYNWNAYYTEAELDEKTKAKIDKACEGLVEHYAIKNILEGKADKGYLSNMSRWSGYVAKVAQRPSVKQSVETHAEQLKAKAFLGNILAKK
jgi:hypothetical protein